MKKKLITLILAITSFLAVGCSNNNSSKGMGDALSDPVIGFKLQFPKKWRNSESINGIYRGEELQVDGLDSIFATRITLTLNIKNDQFADLVNIYVINNDDIAYFEKNNKSISNIKSFDKTKVDYEVKKGDEKTFVIQTPKIENLDEKIKSNKKYKELLTPANKLIENFKTVKPVESKQKKEQEGGI